MRFCIFNFLLETDRGWRKAGDLENGLVWEAGLIVPGVGDDDVVEGRVALAEAREADFEDHCIFYF